MIKYKKLPKYLYQLPEILESVLPNKYKSMNIRIKFVNKKYKLLKHIPEFGVDIVKIAYKFGAGGCFTPNENIYIFDFFYDKICKEEYEPEEIYEMKYVEVLFAILHEIKHQYQFNNRSYTYLKIDELMKNGDYDYDTDPLEIEADGFAEAIVEKNMEKIIDIVNRKEKLNGNNNN